MMATLVQELRNEEQCVADFAHGVVRRQQQASLDDFLSVVLLCTFGVSGVVAYSYSSTRWDEHMVGFVNGDQRSSSVGWQTDNSYQCCCRAQACFSVGRLFVQVHVDTFVVCCSTIGCCRGGATGPSPQAASQSLRVSLPRDDHVERTWGRCCWRCRCSRRLFMRSRPHVRST